MGLTPVMAHTGLQPYRTGLTPTPQTTMPTRQQPPQYSAPVPKYLLAQATPKTPAQNRQPQMMVTVRNPLTVPQTTPGTGRNPFISPATGTNTIPIGTGTGQTNDLFAIGIRVSHTQRQWKGKQLMRQPYRHGGTETVSM